MVLKMFERGRGWITVPYTTTVLYNTVQKGGTHSNSKPLHARRRTTGYSPHDLPVQL